MIELTLPNNEDFNIPKIQKRVIWLYGKPFSGKSTLASKAPNPFFLNTDGNAQYLGVPYRHVSDMVQTRGRLTERMSGWEVLKGYLDLLSKGNDQYNTIVIDLLNDVYEMCRIYMYDKLGITHESDDSFRAWDKVRLEFLSVMRKIVSLPYDNIILISHEDDTKDFTSRSGEKYTSIKPKMQDKVADSIAGMCAFVGRCYVDKGEYKMAISPSDVVFGGGRLNTGNIVIDQDWSEIEKLFDTYNERC